MTAHDNGREPGDGATPAGGRPRIERRTTRFDPAATGGGLAVLVDPARITPDGARHLARRAAEEGASAILLGNSFGGDEATATIARALRDARSGLPIVQFPGTATQLVPDVDAVLLLSLVSGRNAQYLIEEHVRAVPFLARHPEIAVISTAYLLIDGGHVTSVEAVSQTRPLPADKPELVAAHVQAAMLIGMRAVYLDAGSGARRPVSPELVAAARAASPGGRPLFVGGGIRDAAHVRALRAAGADYVVVGTLFERESLDRLGELVAAAALPASPGGE